VRLPWCNAKRGSGIRFSGFPTVLCIHLCRPGCTRPDSLGQVDDPLGITVSERLRRL
jgi:hypothetical protein